MADGGEFIFIGKQFNSFETVVEAIDKYQKVNGVQFYRRDARTIESAAFSRVKRPLNTLLKYYDLRYCCIHGGRKFKKQGSGLREGSTFKKGCGVFIHLSASTDGNLLVVRSMNEQHNHEVNKELFQHLPQQRKLSEALRQEARELMKLKANKKLVQHYMVEKSGNRPTLKDFSNIMLGSKDGSRNDLSTFVNRLKTKYGATVDILAGDNETLQGLLFQDATMKNYMRCFPEVLFIDATYKLLEIRLPIYLTLCEDSMGNSEVVSVGMLASENEESLSWMFQTLRMRNNEMDRVRVIVTDKDMKERQVLRHCFPNTCLLLCLFHTLRTFRREITCEKMGISAGQRTFSLELLQKLAYAHNEEVYDCLYKQFILDVPQTVVNYYNHNWHNIRTEWVVAYALQAGNFLNTTNNRIECINSKLKSVITKFSSLEDFLDKLYIILEAMRLERDSKAARQFLKVSASATSHDSNELQYSRLLTPYAFEFVREQMKKSLQVELQDAEGGIFTINQTDCVIEVTATNCLCGFRRSMLLPCSHMFAVRNKLSLDLFDNLLCDRRWHSDYFKENGRVFAPHLQIPTQLTSHSNTEEGQSGSVCKLPSGSQRVLSGPEKVKLGLQYGASLANLHSDIGMTEFTARLGVYKKLEHLWQAGKRAKVVELVGDGADPVAEIITDNPATGSKEMVQANNASEVFQLTGSTDHFDMNVDHINSEVVTTLGEHGLQLLDTEALYNKSVTAADDQLMEIAVGDVNIDVENSDSLHINLTATSDGSSKARDVTECKTLSVKDIKLPPRMKRCGRPKGQETTVIGLPKKRGTGRMLPFAKLPSSSKEKIMLSWFVAPDEVEMSLKSREKIGKHQVECNQDLVPSACIDAAVDMNLLKKFFAADAWKAVENVVKAKAKSKTYTCGICHDKLGTSSICCDCCLNWFDFKCVALKTGPKAVHWFCRKCRALYAS